MVELNEKALEVGQRVEKYTGEARWLGTILSTYTTGRGKVRHVVEVEPQGFQMIAVPEQLRPAPALPAPDDGLVGRLLAEATAFIAMDGEYDISTGHLLNEAATALQSQSEQIERLREALTFYRDRWVYTPNKRYGGLEWKPSEDLLDDCGNTARSALETQEGNK